ncbi:MAG: type II toxin-antitoxin system VapC family toxin [Gemmatimonadota bacterium]
MARASRRFTLDTNLYIRGFRDADGARALERFHAAFAPFEYLSAIVMQELRSGALTSDAARALESNVFAPFDRRKRLVAPSAESWKLGGKVMSQLAAQNGIPVASMSRSFVNDVLLAATCREHDLVLVTDNARDFTAIRKRLVFDWVQPWPPTDYR